MRERELIFMWLALLIAAATAALALGVDTQAERTREVVRERCR